ncbi:MAG TPA: glycosyltransferase family 2 protein [Chloroflexota bacterium]|nr:glycosyltransferase family 2 protein [Chloroflexota bacterium]
MTHPLIVTVILNTNRRDDTLACLESLAQSDYPHLQTIVLDNHSTDGSVEAIQTAFPQVTIIPLTENLGYAGNNNVGIRTAVAQGADWVFVLNEDTILAPDCLTQMVAVGESDPQIGICGPMVYHHDEPDVIQSAGGVFGRYWESIHLAQNEPDQGQFVQPHAVGWISGCGILVRRAAIEQVGMIDERYFYYWEETEWCLRAGKSGWRVMHVPQAMMWHKGVQRDYHPKPSVTYYGTRNRLLTIAKHRAPLTVWVFTWLQLLRTLTSWTVKPKWRSKRDHRDAMWRGMVDFLQHRWGQMPQ